MYTKISCDFPVIGDVFLPGSKSYTNRAIILASLASGISYLENSSDSDDTSLLIGALKKLRVNIQRQNNTLFIEGTGGKISKFYGNLYLGAAGTTTRFLIPFCCFVGGEIRLSGTARLHERPISNLVEAMRRLGATILYEEKEGHLPILIKGFCKEIKSYTEIDGSLSSQFISALLLIAPVLPQGLHFKITGKQVSKSYIDMTLHYLKIFGIKVDNNNYESYYVPSQSITGNNILIEGDASGASYFWGIAAVTQGKIRVHNLSFSSQQGDTLFAKILESMGCKIEHSSKENWIEISCDQKLLATNVDMSLMPDTAQTLAVVSAIAEGTTKITGLSTLKNKETNRCEAICNELTKLNIVCSYDDDSLTIVGGNPCAGNINTYDDHRMAMSFAVLASAVKDIYIENSYVVSKSFPSFWQKIRELGIKVGSFNGKH